MRSPPPIPPLRRELRIEPLGAGLVIDDPALGRRHPVEGSHLATVSAILSQLRPHLGSRPPSQAELCALVRRPRLEVQEAVSTLLGLHLFDTPRARYLCAAVSLARARGRRPPRLTVGHPLLPLDRVRFVRAMRTGPPLATLGDLVGAAERLVTAIDAFERRFEASEVFATRDAFHIVRPDTEEAPARLGRLVGTLSLASRALAPPLAAGLEVFLAGGRPSRTELRECRISPLGRGGAPLLEDLGRRLLEVFVLGERAPEPEMAAALGDFWRVHRASLLELAVLQAPVFVGLGAPRACPAWWPR